MNTLHRPPTPVTVLVIEDSMDVADSMARFLRVGAGYNVRVAYNGEAGLKAAFADPPDVVVCDLAMPRMNGLRVAEELSYRVPRPLLVADGYHRVCASYWLDENTDIPCRLGALPT